MGDAITVLSANWKDTYNSNTNLSSRVPSATTVNAATLEGIVQSTNVGSTYYSGGVENFLRLEENWSGLTLTYNGSIVVMFPSHLRNQSLARRRRQLSTIRPTATGHLT